MNRKVRIFISYKTGAETGLTFQANAIRQFLEANDLEVWMDTADLAAGLDWNTQIYEQIPRSDVLLLLLAPETAASDWVRREIDVAKGAQVTVLPLRIRGGFNEQEALDHFDIPRLQFVDLMVGDESEYNALLDAIEALQDRTREAQERWLRAMREGEKVVAYEPTTLSVAKFRAHGVDVHIAGGDITEMKGIDVFVNSENDYMQMARAFEATTVSSVLRFLGSNIDGAQRLVEDSLQVELNQQVDTLFGTRPVGKNTVVATSAGHPSGSLRRENKARYVIHTATVSVQGDGLHKRLHPIRIHPALKRPYVAQTN